MPFEDRQDLLEHFADHWDEFGVGTPEEYERLADAFMFGPLSANIEECVRVQGGFCRYDRDTQEYGTVNAQGFLCTYFIPDPAIHGERTNLEYFHKRCR